VTAALAGLGAGMALLGLFLVVRGLTTPPEPRGMGYADSSLSGRAAAWWRALPVTRRRLFALAGLAGVAVYAVTLWFPALLIVPTLLLAVPALLADPPNREIALLEALDRWVRSLVASLPTGKSIPDAIRATARQAPEALRDNVALLAARLAERWSAQEALLAFADDCASPDVDAVVASLVIAADRGGVGATATLEALADSVQDRLAAARDIEVERAKPRIVVRQVTFIIVGVVALTLVSSPSYFAPYLGGAGPFLLLALIGVFLGSLFLLRRSGAPRPRQRILQRRALLAEDEVVPA
jgi:Flp pilus assembly protein TadB